MAKFIFTPKGEAGHTDAEVELLIQQHEKHMVATEIGPLKDDLKVANQAKEDAESKITTAEKQAKKLEGDLKTAQDELSVFTTAEATATRATAIAEAKIIEAKKLDDALALAKVTDEDTAEQAIEKLKTFAEAEGREDYKFVETAEKGKTAHTPSAAELAAISNAGKSTTATKDTTTQNEDEGELPTF